MFVEGGFDASAWMKEYIVCSIQDTDTDIRAGNVESQFCIQQKVF